MLFDRRIESNCSYCRFGEDAGSGRIVCARYGFVDAGDSCRKFKYDPIKRVPETYRGRNEHSYSPEDFTLE